MILKYDNYYYNLLLLLLNLLLLLLLTRTTVEAKNYVLTEVSVTFTFILITPFCTAMVKLICTYVCQYCIILYTTVLPLADIKIDHDGTRTRNLLIRSQTPYPLGYAANHISLILTY